MANSANFGAQLKSVGLPEQLGIKVVKGVTLVEQYFYPDGWSGTEIPRNIAECLAAHGFRVEVLCSSDQYVPAEDNEADDPRARGVRLKRVPGLVAHTDIRKGKWIRQLWFYAASVPLLLFRKPPAMYLTQTNPPLIPAIVAIVARLQRRPVALIAMDIYPEVMFAHGMLHEKSFLGRVLSATMGWAYRRATKVIALGPTMRERLIAKGVRQDRIKIISNWATGAVSTVKGSANALAGEWGLRGAPVIIYSGNLGIAHDIATPIMAFELALLERPALKLLFIGAGSRLEEAKNLVREKGLQESVMFRDLVPSERVPESMGLAHVALVTLKPGFEGLVVPSKLLGYMARGLPTLYIGPDSDAAQVICASKGGAVFSNEDLAGIARFMVSVVDNGDQLHVRGENARRYYFEHLSKEAGLGHYVEIVKSIAGDPLL